MVILYGAVAVIIIGIVTVLYSEIFEHSASRTIPHDRFVPNFDDESDELKSNMKQNEISAQDDVPIIDIRIKDSDHTSSKDAMDISSHDMKDSVSEPNSNDSTVEYEVVFFTDNSGNIGNTAGEKEADDWSSFKRIGNGTLQHVHQGINIKVDNRLYRYDFSRIDSMKTYDNDNYMLFKVKGKTAVNCIVMNKTSDILQYIQHEFKIFNESPSEAG